MHTRVATIVGIVAAALLLAGCGAQLDAEPEQRRATRLPERTWLAEEREPTPSATVPPAAHVISEQARHVLDTNLGAGFEASPAIKDQYCTMSDAMLESAARIAVDSWRDITEADVVAYVGEACGR